VTLTTDIRYNRTMKTTQCLLADLPADPRDYSHSDKHREARVLKREGIKRCTRCMQIKPLDDFYCYRGSHAPHCKLCDHKRVSAYIVKRYREDADFREKQKEHSKRQYRKLKSNKRGDEPAW